MWKEVIPGLRMTAAFTVLTGLLYPGVVTALGQALFPWQANGSLVVRGGKVVGSALIGQEFRGAEYFHGRPSAAGAGYDGLASGGSNLGPTSAKLVARTRVAAEEFRRENPGYAGEIPAGMVSASGSGLDPHISVEGAEAQVERVARARGMSVQAVRRLVAEQTRGRWAGVLGEARVNVLELNLALDAAQAAPSR